MAATVSASVLGKHKSVVRAAPLSAVNDTLTVNHGLGASPDQIVATLRTIRSVVSTGVPGLICLSWDATAAVFSLPAVNAAGAVSDWDVVCEVTHSVAR